MSFDIYSNDILKYDNQLKYKQAFNKNMDIC